VPYFATRREMGTLKNRNYGKFIPLEVVVFLGLGRFMGFLTGFNIKAVLLIAELFIYI
jgi:hypothetical protein